MINRLLKPIRNLFARSGGGSNPTEASTSHRSEGSGTVGSGEVTLNHVWTDRPDAIKLQANRLFSAVGERRHYSGVEETGSSPLARLLLEMEGVDSVAFEGLFATIVLNAEADWDPLMVRIPQAIGKFLKAGGTAVQDAAAPQSERRTMGKTYNFGFRQVTPRPREEQMKIVQELLDNEVNPAVSAHGGFFSLVDVKDDTVYVQLGGGCQGCGMANVTLRQGVEQRMKEVLPEMAALVDVTDHASGENPYYQAGKK